MFMDETLYVHVVPVFMLYRPTFQAIKQKCIGYFKTVINKNRLSRVCHYCR